MTHSWRHAVRLLFVSVAAATALSACASMGVGPTVKRSAFSSEEFGVKSSPRITNNPNPPKGGGRNMVGKPYVVRGTTFVPQENPVGYAAVGKGSWYGADFHGRLTANGEIFSANAITGAHPTMPLPSYVRVTNQENGRTLVVRVNDRGPYLPGRVMDLSYRSAAMLGYVDKGSAELKVEYLGRAPLEGDDTRALVASYHGPQEFGNHTEVATMGGGSGGLFGMIGGLFAYSEDAPASASVGATALDATSTMASFLPGPGIEHVNIALGTVVDPLKAAMVAQQFAMLGAVERVDLGSSGTQLSMIALKPGVSANDVQMMAGELGLPEVIRY